MGGKTRDEYWDDRLRNWGEWIAGAGRDSGRIISTIYDPALWRSGYGDGMGEGGVLADTADALDVQSLIKEFLSNVHFQAVHVWYVEKGTHESHARMLGVHVNTLRERVKAAKDNLERGQWERNKAARKRQPKPN